MQMHWHPPGWLTLWLRAWVALLACAGNAAAQDTVLRTAAEVRRLSPEEAAEGRAVELRGVVTFFDHAQFSRFVQDGTAGIYLTDFTGYPDLKAGDEVRVTGVTDSGEYAPVVTPTRIDVLGRMPLPEPRRVVLEDLASGQEDSQWVEVQGIVRRVIPGADGQVAALELATGGGLLKVETGAVTLPAGQPWVDCSVRVRGVCSSSFNRGRQLFGSRLLVARAVDILVESRPDADVSGSPAQPLGSLLRFAPRGSQGRRIRVAGTVVHQLADGSFYIADGQAGLLVESAQPGRLAAGAVVDALGFPAPGEYTPVLEDAEWQQTGTADPPAPVTAPVDELLSGARDCTLVQLEGRLVDRMMRPAETLLVLETDGVLWTVWIEKGSAVPSVQAMENGSRLQVTGVCRVDVGPEWRAGAEWRARGFHLLARSDGDLRVLSRPSWWTLTRLLWMTGILLTSALAALAWVALLRRTVTRQTEIIRRQLAVEASLRARYQTLIDHADDLVCTLDAAGTVTSVNPASETLLQRPPAALTGKPLTDFIVPAQQEAAREWLRGIREGAGGAGSEWDFLTPDAQLVRLEIHTQPLPGPAGQQEVEAIARDVTEQRRLEREVLEVSTREQSRIAHDLHDGVCQQLAGLAFLADLLAERLEEHHATGAAEARRISDTVNHVNSQARNLARGLFPAALEENGLVVALEELAANAAALFGIRCEFRCAEPVTIRSEIVAHHLFYIAQEAMLNAARHGRPGHIAVTLAPSGERCVLTIADDGTGLPAARSGGMGLRIMHYRARQIGASLDISPRPDGGTRVACAFSLREASASGNAADPRAGEA